MPQKRMAARGQSAKLAKGPSPKKAPVAKPMKVEKAKKAKVVVAPAPVAAKSKVSAKISPNTTGPIEKAKAALKTELKKEKTNVPVAAVVEAKALPTKTEGKRARKINVDITPGEGVTALSGKWATLFKKAEQIDSKPYNMRSVFEEKTAIVHKVLGWGYILANRNDRLEVLFKDGIKYLISNYKP